MHCQIICCIGEVLDLPGTHRKFPQSDRLCPVHTFALASIEGREWDCGLTNVQKRLTFVASVHVVAHVHFWELVEWRDMAYRGRVRPSVLR